MSYYIRRHCTRADVDVDEIESELRDARFLVRAGAEALGDIESTWRPDVSAARLDMSCAHACVLGQVFGHFRAGADAIARYYSARDSAWADVVDDLSLRLSEPVDASWTRHRTAVLGLDWGLVGADALHVAWLEELTQERYHATAFASSHNDDAPRPEIV